MGIVYKAVCSINNKVYVGKTQRTLDVRIKEHFVDIFRYKNNKFYNAIQKHGWESFTWSIEYKGSISDDDLSKLEIDTIQKYNSYKNGYNSTLGGDSSPMHIKDVAKKVSLALSGENNPMYGKHHSDAAKAKMSQARKGKKFSQTHRDNLSRANMGKKLSNDTKLKISKAKLGKKLSEEHKRKISQSSSKSMLGRKHSEETKLKISRARIGIVISRQSILKKIETMKNDAKNRFYVFRDGMLIGEWGSQKDCAADLDLISQSINMCLMGRRKTHKGYTFKRCEDE